MRFRLLLGRLLVSFPWLSAKLPSSGQRENKTDPFSLSSLSDFFEVSTASAELEKKKRKKKNAHGSVHQETPPSPLPCCWLLTNFKGLVSYFPVYGFTHWHHTFHLRKSLPEADILVSVCAHVCVCVWDVNHVIICYRHTLHCGWDTGLVVWNPGSHQSLAPHDVIQLFKDLAWPPSLWRNWLCIGYRFHGFPSCIFIGHCVLMRPLCCFDITAEIARLMPAITWGRFRG